MDNEYPRMLYRFPAQNAYPSVLLEGAFDVLVVDSQEQEDGADGWHRSAEQAKDAGKPQAAPTVPDDDAPPTRAELETKARELGIPAKGTWGDRKIADAISEKLKAGHVD